jgi:hypothetical protein
VTDAPSYEDVAIPALRRRARSSYGDAIRRSLAAAGCGDVPRNGAFVIGGMNREALESVDAVLAKRVSPAELAGLRAGLAALAEARGHQEG